MERIASPAPLSALKGRRLPELQRSPGSLIRRAQQVHTRLWSKRRELGMTSVQYAALLAAAENPGLDQTALGDRISLDKSTAADVVLRLSRQGLVVRERAKEDSRRRPMRLTPRGWEAFEGALSAVMEVQTALLESLLPSDRERFIMLLQTVAFDGSPPPPSTPGKLLPGEFGRGVRGLSLPHAPGHLIRRAQQVHTALWGQLVGTDITSVQYSILLVLHDLESTDQGTLGLRTSLDKSTVGDVVNRLVERGVVDRRRDSGDGRRNILELSKVGRSVLFDCSPGVFAVQEQLVSGLADGEGDELIDLLATIVASTDNF